MSWTHPEPKAEESNATVRYKQKTCQRWDTECSELFEQKEEANVFITEELNSC